MDIARRIQDGWGLGPVLEVRNLGGSGVCWLVVTGQGSFVYKQVGREDFVAIYDKVQRTLNHNRLLQAKVVPSKDGRLILPDGFSLFEYVFGDAPEDYTDDQFTSAVKYLWKYNRALRKVPFGPNEIAQINIWDEVRSTEFICDRAVALAQQPVFDNPARTLLRRAAGALHDSLGSLDRLPKQLIHGDPGPGNIIFDGSEVVAIIDFTPDYENELYSLAQFLYWTCLWQYDPGSKDRIARALAVYCSEGDPHASGQVLFSYLLKACMFRIMGPALNALRNGTLDLRKVARRLSALENLFGIEI